MFRWLVGDKGQMELVEEYLTIEDNRSRSSLSVKRGEKNIGHIVFFKEHDWRFIPYTAHTDLNPDDLEEIADKLRDLNDE